MCLYDPCTKNLTLREQYQLNLTLTFRDFSVMRSSSILLAAIGSSPNNKPWREAASILLTGLGIPQSTKSSKPSWKGPELRKDIRPEFLILKRSKGSPFMPGGLCFPGGTVSEGADTSYKWLQLYKDVDGLNLQTLYFINTEEAKHPDLYINPDHNLETLKAAKALVNKQVILRLTAIRETFEEVGILLCRSISTKGIDELERFNRDPEEIRRWQGKVKANPEEFYNLCQGLECVPDLHRLRDWSNWLTPTSFSNPRNRFDTIFYLVTLPQSSYSFGASRPTVIYDPHEIESFRWTTAAQVLKEHWAKREQLMPPQLYEMTRMMSITKLEQFDQLTRSRELHGLETWCPFILKAQDGFLNVLPGDELYPTEPDLINHAEIKTVDGTLAELERSTIKLHRFVTPNSGAPGKAVVSNSRYGQVYTTHYNALA